MGALKTGDCDAQAKESSLIQFHTSLHEILFVHERVSLESQRSMAGAASLRSLPVKLPQAKSRGSEGQRHPSRRDDGSRARHSRGNIMIALKLRPKRTEQ